MALALAWFASCSGNKAAAGDSAEIADSVAADTAATESVAEVVEEVNPEEALKLTVESKNLRWVGEAKQGSWTVKVTNEGAAPVKGDAYEVTYKEMLEQQNSDGEFVDVTKTRTIPGKDIAPGESETFELKASNGCMDFKNPAIKNVK